MIKFHYGSFSKALIVCHKIFYCLSLTLLASAHNEHKLPLSLLSLSHFTIFFFFFLLSSIFQLKHNMLFHTARAMCIAWSPDSSKIVSGAIDTNICVWDANKGEKITMIKGIIIINNHDQGYNYNIYRT